MRDAYPDVPIILHSSRPENEALARSVGANFLLKGSPLLLQELREVMLHDFAFGDFVFRASDGTEVARAGDLRSLEEQLAIVPEESILRHAGRNHFSRCSRRGPSSRWPKSCGPGGSPNTPVARRCGRA